MYCRACGKKVRAAARFCADCGAPMGNAVPPMALRSGISRNVWIAIGAVAGIVLIGMLGVLGLDKWREARAAALFQEAHQLVQQGQEAEKTSYTEAFERYKTALDKVETITRDYASTSSSIQLLRDPMLGTYTLEELKETIVPDMQKKAALEGDLLAVARLQLNKIKDDRDGYGGRDFAASLLANRYAEAGRYDEAMELIGTISGDSSKSRALHALLEAHAKTGHLEQAKQIAESFQVPGFILSFARVRATRVLAVSLANEHLPDQAQQILDQAKQVTDIIGNANQKVSLQREFEEGYFSVAIAYIELGQYQQAEDIAATISWSAKAPYILAHIAHKYAESQQFDKARAFAEGIQDAGGKAIAFAYIAERYAEAGRFDDAMRIVEGLQDSDFKDDEASSAIAVTYARSGHYDQAIQVANGTSNRHETFTKIVTATKPGELPPTLLRAVNGIADPYMKTSTLMAIVDALAKTGRADEGLQIARTIGNPGSRVFSLILIANLYSDAKKSEEAARIHDELEQVLGTIEDPTSKVHELGFLAQSYVRAGRMDQAIRLAATIEDSYGQIAAFAAIAAGYQRAGQIDKALEVLSQAIETFKTVAGGSADSDSQLELVASSLVSDHLFGLALHVCASLDAFHRVLVLSRIGAMYAQSEQKLDRAGRKILHDIIAANQ